MRNVDYLIRNNVDVNKSLELFGDIDTYNNTLGEFLVSANNKLADLEKYKNNKDMANYAIFVHSLKSDAKYFGFNELANLAYEHELKSKAGDIYYIINKFNDLATEINETVQLIKDYLYGEEEKESVIENEKVESKEKAILVVDDSNIVRNFTRRIFEKDYEILSAKDGSEAINAIKIDTSHKIVAMLLDLNMPVVDGFKVLEYMQEEDLFKTLPVSIISGDSSKETIDKAFKYPIVDMLEKPFTEQAIKAVVQKTLWYNEVI